MQGVPLGASRLLLARAPTAGNCSRGGHDGPLPHLGKRCRTAGSLPATARLFPGASQPSAEHGRGPASGCPLQGPFGGLFLLQSSPLSWLKVCCFSMGV